MCPINELNYIQYYSFYDNSNLFNSNSSFDSLRCDDIQIEFRMDDLSNVELRDKVFFLLYLTFGCFPKVVYNRTRLPGRRKMYTYGLKLSVTIKNISKMYQHLSLFFLEKWNSLLLQYPKFSFSDVRQSIKDKHVYTFFFEMKVSAKAYFDNRMALPSMSLDEKDVLFLRFKIGTRSTVLGIDKLDSKRVVKYLPFFWKVSDRILNNVMV